MKSTEVQNPRRMHRVAYYANARARKLTTPHDKLTHGAVSSRSNTG